MGRGCGGCPAFVGCWQLRHGGSGAIAARCCTLPQHATDGGCVHPSFLCSVKLIFILTASSFLNNLELSIFTNGSCAYHLYPFETNKKKIQRRGIVEENPVGVLCTYSRRHLLVIPLLLCTDIFRGKMLTTAFPWL